FVALSWQLIVVFILAWAVVAAITRYSSLASLMATALTGVASFAIFNQEHQLQLIGAIFWIVAFTFQRHKENIERLKNGTEGKIGQKSN
ncbi:MAG: glycerol-3-phosphate acyltransferase, partial [Arenicella sp.]|nr:glycerol-3-phosphate acyltransferase [Arenicella sp.]